MFIFVMASDHSETSDRKRLEKSAVPLKTKLECPFQPLSTVSRQRIAGMPGRRCLGKPLTVGHEALRRRTPWPAILSPGYASSAEMVFVTILPASPHLTGHTLTPLRIANLVL